MTIAELIQKKRDGLALSNAELETILNAYNTGTMPDYQMSAFLMAVFFSGMNEDETNNFTRLMLESGTVVDLSHIPGVKVDKHSTGGVGDKISLLLAPIVAACGVSVPMISGRGLGHTGGTLDKLESIPGFRTNLSLTEYRRVIEEIGIVMIGQTAQIAPIDRRMYALRDVTATVASIPLISGSIMSKKLAEGIDALVLDIKTGKGAFMADYDKAESLAHTLVDIGTRFGKETIGFITEMGEPLGNAIGNWVEVVESIEGLQGKAIEDIMELTYVLSGAMIMLGRKAPTISEGIRLAQDAVHSGKAFEKFLQMVKRQGGDISVLESPSIYAKSKHEITVVAQAEGFVASIDALELGLSSILLGAGREKIDDQIDPKAGIILYKKRGDRIRKGDTLAKLLTDRDDLHSAIASRVEKAFSIAQQKPEKKPLILAMVDRNGVHPYSI